MIIHFVPSPQDPSAYEDWRCQMSPNVLEIFKTFPSCKPSASALLAHLMPLQPRFYSISSSPASVPDQIHLTVSVVRYNLNDDPTQTRYGVCSNYLERLQENDQVYIFVRRYDSINNMFSRAHRS